MVEQAWFSEGLSDMCQPSYCLQFDKASKKSMWLFNTGHRTFLPYPWGIEVQPIESFTDIDSEVPCMIGFELVMIPPDYIVSIGWN